MPECFSYDEKTGTLTLYPSITITTTESLEETRLKPAHVCFAEGDWSRKDDIINRILKIVCRENRFLKSCDLPNSVTKIVKKAFFRCDNLTSINIPAGVTEIGEKAFCRCNLTSVNIPAGVTKIGDGAFSDCSSLTSITLPDSVTGIGNFAFWGCSNLTKITFCGYLVNIGRGIFEGCSELQTIEVCSKNMQKKISEYIAKAGLNVSVVVSQNTQTNPNGSVPCRKKIPTVILCNNRGR